MQTQYQLRPEVIKEINKQENLDLRIQLIDYFRCHPTNMAKILKQNDVKLTQYGALEIIARYFKKTKNELVQPVGTPEMY
ncbi:MAG: hypothetical protein Fur0028_06260 [Bacteroidales bacterium]|nr:hypothetical protein [Bacteroidales bacterium]